MSEENNVKTIQQIYEAFSRGDIPFILGTLSDDVKWVTHLESVVPWAGDYSGKSRVPQFFQAIAQSVDVTAFTPGEFIAQGDRVCSVGQFGCRAKSTGKSASTRWVFLWTVQNGRVTSYEQFHDRALADAFRP